jgi:GNAT superfamily N-acetyltransferase
MGLDETNEYTVSTDKKQLQLEVIHHYLSNDSYWAAGIPLETVKRSIENSLNFGVYHGQKQVGYARVITDYATTAYLADVFILPQHRGKGLSKLLMKNIMNYPQVQGLRRWILATRDAHGLYAQFGWTAMKKPDKWMELHNPDIYKR